MVVRPKVCYGEERCHVTRFGTNIEYAVNVDLIAVGPFLPHETDSGKWFMLLISLVKLHTNDTTEVCVPLHERLYMLGQLQGTPVGYFYFNDHTWVAVAMASETHHTIGIYDLPPPLQENIAVFVCCFVDMCVSATDTDSCWIGIPSSHLLCALHRYQAAQLSPTGHIDNLRVGPCKCTRPKEWGR